MVSKTVERFVMKLPLSTTQIDDGKRSVSIVKEARRVRRVEAIKKLPCLVVTVFCLVEATAG